MNTDFTDTGMPACPDVEKAILGSILLDNEQIDEVRSKLQPEHFYTRAHRTIYSTICALADKDKSIDQITLIETLKKQRSLADVGGIGYIMDLTSGAMRIPSLGHYIELAIDAAVKRSIINASNGVLSMAIDNRDSAEDILTAMESAVDSLSDKRSATTEQVGAIAYQRYKDGPAEFYRHLGKLHGLSTGYLDLDNVTHGLVAPRVYIIAARPSMGKTALASGIAEDVAFYQGKTVLVFSLEMGREELTDRIIFSQALLNSERIKSGNIFHEDEVAMAKAVERMNSAPLYIDDQPGITPMDVVAKCKLVKAQVGSLDLVVIDYLQLMTAGKKCENRTQEVGYVSRKLKEAAKKLGVPIIALSQLNRGIESRSPKEAEPKLSDLRESGDIEQDADVVVMLHRPDFYDKDDPEIKGITKVFVRKNRHGMTANLQMGFLGGCTRFETLDKNEWIGHPASN